MKGMRRTLDVHREDEVARQELETAERLLSRCAGAHSSGGVQVQGGAARQLMQRLQAAYSHLWQLQLREGLAELVVMPSRAKPVNISARPPSDHN